MVCGLWSVVCGLWSVVYGGGMDVQYNQRVDAFSTLTRKLGPRLPHQDLPSTKDIHYKVRPHLTATAAAFLFDAIPGITTTTTSPYRLLKLSYPSEIFFNLTGSLNAAATAVLFEGSWRLS